MQETLVSYQLLKLSTSFLEKRDFKSSSRYLDKYISTIYSEFDTYDSLNLKFWAQHYENYTFVDISFLVEQDRCSLNLLLAEHCLKFYNILFDQLIKYNSINKYYNKPFLYFFLPLKAILSNSTSFGCECYIRSESCDKATVISRCVRKSICDFYCLFLRHCIIDENYFEYKIFKNNFDKIVDKIFSYNHSMIRDPSFECYSGIFLSQNIEYIFQTDLLTEVEKNHAKLMTYRRSYKVNFPPYIGKLLSEIINETPKQFLNLIINLNHFSVFEEVLMDEQLMGQDLFLKAFIKNRMKRLYQVERSNFFSLRDFTKSTKYSKNYRNEK